MRRNLLGLALLLVAMPARAGGPIDAPVSNEPRVAVAKCLTAPGLVESRGNYQPWFRAMKGELVHSRDVLVALPGFKVDLEALSKGVTLTLWGNLPGLSDSPVLESSVVLHDTRAFDLDMTILNGRIVLTNTREKGPAKVWVRADEGVELVLPAPGDSVAIEVYGRWAAGVPFLPGRKSGLKPIRLWELYCLKGNLEIKAARTQWYLTQPPGLAYFHGDSVNGPWPAGPEKLAELPSWYSSKKPNELAKMIDNVVQTYTGRLKFSDPDEIDAEVLALADKETNPERARVMRMLVVYANQALDEVDKVAEALSTSKHKEMREAAVIALRHWIGAGESRDEKLYNILHSELGYTKSEAATVLQLLHSPFNREQAETYETLIAYLKHRKQSIRELAHWHLVRLAPIGRDIEFDAAAPSAEREKAASKWRALIPPGTLPKEKPDDTKKSADR